MSSCRTRQRSKRNALAARGYSCDHRPDCKQVCIALLVSFDGFPLGYEVFTRNMIGRVWIADHGSSLELSHTQPDVLQLLLLERLGITLPKACTSTQNSPSH